MYLLRARPNLKELKMMIFCQQGSTIQMNCPQGCKGKRFYVSNFCNQQSHDDIYKVLNEDAEKKQLMLCYSTPKLYKVYLNLLLFKGCIYRDKRV